MVEIKTFRQDHENLKQGAYGPHLNHYLQQQLLPSDWQLWQSLQIDTELDSD